MFVGRTHLLHLDTSVGLVHTWAHRSSPAVCLFLKSDAEKENTMLLHSQLLLFEHLIEQILWIQSGMNFYWGGKM